MFFIYYLKLKFLRNIKIEDDNNVSNGNEVENHIHENKNSVKGKTIKL